VLWTRVPSERVTLRWQGNGGSGWNVAGELNVDLDKPTVPGPVRRRMDQSRRSHHDGDLFFSKYESIERRQRAHRTPSITSPRPPAKDREISPWECRPALGVPSVRGMAIS